MSFLAGAASGLRRARSRRGSEQ